MCVCVGGGGVVLGGGEDLGGDLLAFLHNNGKFSTGLFTSRTTPPHYILEHIRGDVVIGESLVKF